VSSDRSRSRRRFGAVRKLPSGRWQVRYRTPAGDMQAAPTTFPNRAQADRWLSLIEADLERGDWRDPRLGRITFAEWVDFYLDASNHKRPTTLSRDRHVLGSHFLPVFGDRHMANITPLDVRHAVERMSKRLAPSTVRTNYGVLKTVFNSAVEADVIGKTPCRGIKVMQFKSREPEPLTPAQVDALASAIDEEYRPVIYLAAVLGLRWSEVAGLRVRHLDFLNRRLRLVETTAEVDGHLLEHQETKSKAGTRTLAVPLFLMEMLSAHLAARGRPGPDELVFVTRRGRPLRASNFRTKVWSRAVRASGLEGLTFRDLRHVATSFMVQAKEHPRVIQHRLGHSTSRLSMELYAHVDADSDQRAAAHLQEMFDASRASANETPADDKLG
jgi:integrase